MSPTVLRIVLHVLCNFIHTVFELHMNCRHLIPINLYITVTGFSQILLSSSQNAYSVNTRNLGNGVKRVIWKAEQITTESGKRENVSYSTAHRATCALQLHRYCIWVTNCRHLIPINLYITVTCYSRILRLCPHNQPYWTIFSNEAWFSLSRYVSSQNNCNWADNPHVHFGTPLHPDTIGVWCTLLRTNIIGPLFFYYSDHRRGLRFTWTLLSSLQRC